VQTVDAAQLATLLGMLRSMGYVCPEPAAVEDLMGSKQHVVVAQQSIWAGATMLL
jgi:hypothetical protein